LAESGSYFFGPGLEPKRIVVGVVLAASGSMVTMGLWTPIASVVLAAVMLVNSFSRAGRPVANPNALPVALYVIAIAIAVALLGPGAHSLDCRRVGPREVIIPKPTRRS